MASAPREKPDLLEWYPPVFADQLDQPQLIFFLGLDDDPQSRVLIDARDGIFRLERQRSAAVSNEGPGDVKIVAVLL